MGTVQQLALALDAEERTLRRAVSQGTIRSWRPGPRRLHLLPGEEEYLRDHWQLLAGLRQALRTERQVRLAVLYGSVARGDDDEGSDLDLLVALVGPRPAGSRDLTNSVRKIAGRTVDVAHLDRVEATAPLLLDRIVDEGRVLVDREELWMPLKARRRAIRARAKRSHQRQVAEAAEAIARLAA